MASISTGKSALKILDLGGTPQYWARVGFDFIEEINAEVTIVNASRGELAYDGAMTSRIKLQQGDACALDYGDNEFDFCHSNSVIEHVETWSNMKSFAAETRRVAPSYYVQTPYFWFPIDPHYYKMPFFHWYPRPVRARLLNALPITHSGRIAGVDEAFDVVDRARLLDGRQFRFLFPDAEVSFERFAGLAKSMIAVRRPNA